MTRATPRVLGLPPVFGEGKPELFARLPIGDLEARSRKLDEWMALDNKLTAIDIKLDCFAQWVDDKRLCRYLLGEMHDMFCSLCDVRLEE